jgi:hypothetical protein
MHYRYFDHTHFHVFIVYSVLYSRAQVLYPMAGEGLLYFFYPGRWAYRPSATFTRSSVSGGVSFIPQQTRAAFCRWLLLSETTPQGQLFLRALHHVGLGHSKPCIAVCAPSSGPFLVVSATVGDDASASYTLLHDANISGPGFAHMDISVTAFH